MSANIIKTNTNRSAAD